MVVGGGGRFAVVDVASAFMLCGLEETETFADVASVGYGAGFALASLFGIQTIIWPRPRLAHA